MKPILFNTNMVRAILEGRKTVTRRVVKFKLGQNPQWTGYIPDGPVLYGSNNIPASKSPYLPGDILYVRETWRVYEVGNPPPHCVIEYKAGGTEKFSKIIALPTTKGEWKPSIHMPKEAARLFLRVTDVRAERLWRMDTVDALAEGMRSDYPGTKIGVVDAFCKLWDSTIKPADLPLYGWEANPWVWVIDFEHISKEAALKGGDLPENRTDRR